MSALEDVLKKDDDSRSPIENAILNSYGEGWEDTAQKAADELATLRADRDELFHVVNKIMGYVLQDKFNPKMPKVLQPIDHILAQIEPLELFDALDGEPWEDEKGEQK